MTVAVLMTCHNRRDTTLRCLERLASACDACCVSEFDTWLLDDGSTDNTSAAVAERFPMVHIVRGDGNLFWSKGMRKVWAEASHYRQYDFYLWLNDDVMLKRDSIKDAFADCHSVGGVVVGACSEDESESRCSYGATDYKDRKIVPNGSPQKASGWFNGNFVVVPRKIADTVGMISNEYSHARADYDYAERLKMLDIPFFSTSGYVGVCSDDSARKVNRKSLWQRIESLWTPGYWNLLDLWRIRMRYHGAFRAIISCCHLIAIVLVGAADRN